MAKEVNSSEIYLELNSYLELLVAEHKLKHPKDTFFNKFKQERGELNELLNQLHKYFALSLNPEQKQALQTRSQLNLIISQIETLNLPIAMKDINSIKTAIEKDKNYILDDFYQNKEIVEKEITQKLEKSMKKNKELSKNAIKVSDDNIKLGDIKRKYLTSERHKYKSASYWIIELPGDPTFSQAVSQFIQKKTIELTSEKIDNQTINYTGNIASKKHYESERKLITEYQKFISNGTIKPIPKFKPNKTSEQLENLEKLRNIVDALEQLEIKSNQQFNNTNQTITSIKKKYQEQIIKLEQQLKNDLSIIQDEVKSIIAKEQEQKEFNFQFELIKEYSKKIALIANNDKLTEEQKQEIKELTEKIKMITGLDASQKEQAIEAGKIEYAKELEYQKNVIEAKREEQKQNKEAEKDTQINLRIAAIKELELENAFNPNYEEKNGDIRDTITKEQKEELIKEKMSEISSRKNLSLEEMALFDLKRLGYIKREDATLSNLKPFEKEALLAQIRLYNEVYQNRQKYNENFGDTAQRPKR